MIVAVWISLAGFIALGIVLLARYLDVAQWQRSLVAFRLLLPSELRIDDVMRWLTSVAASTHPPALSILPLPPVAVEIVAAAHGIGHYVLVTKSAEPKLLAGLRANLPGVRLEAIPGYLSGRTKLRLAAEAVMTSHVRPLATDRAEAAATALLASLQPVSVGSEIRYQLIMTAPAHHPGCQLRTSRSAGHVYWRPVSGILAADGRQTRHQAQPRDQPAPTRPSPHQPPDPPELSDSLQATENSPRSWTRAGSHRSARISDAGEVGAQADVQAMAEPQVRIGRALS